MNKKQRDPSRKESEKDEVSPEAAGSENTTSGRSADGRFVSPHSGNRKGRPPKPKTSPNEERKAILQDERKAILDGENPLKQPIFAGMSMRQSLFMAMCLQGLKNYKAALAALTLDDDSELSGYVPDQTDTDELDALDFFVERELRRKRLQNEVPPDTEEPDTDEEGSS